MENEKEVPWYSEEAGLFGEVYFEVYNQILPEELTIRQTDFIENKLKLKPGDKVFDLCCGHGRHSIELAKRGYNVTGQDLNKYFLDIAKSNADASNVSINWIHDDMRNINFENEFDAVICIFTAFGYLENDEEDEKVIIGAGRSLKKGGRFFIEMGSRDWIVRNFAENNELTFENGVVEKTTRKFDHLQGKNFDYRTFTWPDGRQKEVIQEVRMYTVPEYIRMFKNAGMKLTGSYGNFLGEPISLTTRRYLLIAEKK
jgi:ubiquinone/menaquinone biosynthesis C-methylase UbiE